MLIYKYDVYGLFVSFVKSQPPSSLPSRCPPHISTQDKASKTISFRRLVWRGVGERGRGARLQNRDRDRCHSQHDTDCTAREKLPMNKFAAEGLEQINSSFGVEKFD